MAVVDVTCPKCGVSWKGNLRPGVSVTIGANGPPSGDTASAPCLVCSEWPIDASTYARMAGYPPRDVKPA